MTERRGSGGGRSGSGKREMRHRFSRVVCLSGLKNARDLLYIKEELHGAKTIKDKRKNVVHFLFSNSWGRDLIRAAISPADADPMQRNPTNHSFTGKFSSKISTGRSASTLVRASR